MKRIWMAACVMIVACTTAQKATKSEQDFGALVKESVQHRDSTLDFLADEKLPNVEYVDTTSADRATAMTYTEKLPTRNAVYRIQIFAGSPANAYKNFARMDSSHPDAVYMIHDLESDQWKVWVGDYMTRADAEQGKRDMIAAGYPDAWIHEMKAPDRAGNLFWVQVGSFAAESSADKLKTEVETKQKEPVRVQKKDAAWKVWVGGYGERPPADELKKRLQDLGYTQAFVVQSEE